MVFIKRIIYLLAWLFSFLFIAGFLFKLLRLPYAFQLLYIGETGATFLCFPLIFYFKWRESKLLNRFVFYQWLIGISALIIFTTSTWIRFSSEFYANLVMTGSFVLFAFAFLPLLFYNMYRQSLVEI